MQVSIHQLTDINIVFELGDSTLFSQKKIVRNEEQKLELFEKLVNAEHSPIRALLFMIKMSDIPYYVSVHLVRHKIGVEHYVQSQRNDRTVHPQYDRAEVPQGQLINHAMLINVQELIFMARKRLCSNAHPNTRSVVAEIKKQFQDSSNKYWNIIAKYMMKECEYRKGCHEVNSCKFYKPL